MAAPRLRSGHVLFTIMSEGQIAGGIDPAFDWQNGSTNHLTIVGRGTRFVIHTNDTLLKEFDVTDPVLPPTMPTPPARPSDPSDATAMDRSLRELQAYEEELDRIRGMMSPPSGAETVFERGFVAMLAMRESGTTTCQFEDAWLWLIEE